MDETLRPTYFQTAVAVRPNSTSRRRVYLDTYAKKRAVHAGVNMPKTQTQPVAVQPQIQPAVQPAGYYGMEQSIKTQVQPTFSNPAVSLTDNDTIKSAAATMPAQAPAQAAKSKLRYKKVNANHVARSTASPTQVVKKDDLANSQLKSKKIQKSVNHKAKLVSTLARKAISEQQLQKTATNNKTAANKAIKSNRLEANLKALYGESLAEQIAKNRVNKYDKKVKLMAAGAGAAVIFAISAFAFFGLNHNDVAPIVAQPVNTPVIEVEAPAQQAAPSSPAKANGAAAHRAVKPTDPVRIVISKIGVNAPVDGVGQTADGAIDVPRAYGIVGWYNRGATVGEANPAIMVGHYASGGGAVFDKLNGLVDGDLITVTNGKGENFTYKVVKKAEYNKDQVPMAELFKKSDKQRLEIITCSGKWQADTYNNRLVVTAERVH